MRLKIDKIQELIDSIDYVEKPHTHLFKKNEDGIYTCFWVVDECLYRGQAIVDNIIPFYINNVRNTQLYNLLPYDSIKDETQGLFLGIPFYKVHHADAVYNKWYSDTLNQLKEYQSELDRKSKLGFFEDDIPYLEGKIEQLANSIDNRDLKKQKIWNQYTIIANNFESAQQEKINKANKYKQAYIDRDALLQNFCALFLKIHSIHSSLNVLQR